MNELEQMNKSLVSPGFPGRAAATVIYPTCSKLYELKHTPTHCLIVH